MEKVRFGIVGMGNMGSSHAAYLNSVPRAVLAAVCDVDADRRDRAAQKHAVPAFATPAELIGSGVCDAVLVATPHFDHTAVGIAVLDAGLHLLVEKPIAVGVKAARELIVAAATRPGQRFGIMYNQRSNPMYQALRKLVADGELGELSRVTWIVTDWFRTHAYYASGGWRATWAGEGGGVLINQCPHNLDLIQWVTGLMPARVTAVGYLGKTHPIEVEDEISAIFEYPGGATGHFITSTGEAPGTNRLEICGSRGKVIAERGKLAFTRNRHDSREVNAHSPEPFATIEAWEIDLPVGRAAEGSEHKRVTTNFVNSILDGTPLLAPGEEGVRGLEIGNAMLMSAMTGVRVDLPIDGDAYDALIEQLAREHGGKKTLKTKETTADISASASGF